MIRYLLPLSMLLLALPTTLQAQTKVNLTLMPQVVYGGYNIVEFPRTIGSRISLSDDFTPRNNITVSPRAELEVIYRRNHFVFTGATLHKEYQTVAKDPMAFGQLLIQPGAPVDAIYKFNTYRFTYRYGVVNNAHFKLELGVTVLVRDAMISMQTPCGYQAFYNIGVAPLLSYRVAWSPTQRFSMVSYGDAFGLKVGRAEDIYAGVEWNFIPHLTALMGYRMLEGGSSNERIYTYALFHMGTVGLRVNF